MKLYRYELGLGDDGAENVADKQLVGEFLTSDIAIDWIRKQNQTNHTVFAVIACNADESLDDVLWLLDFGGANGA